MKISSSCLAAATQTQIKMEEILNWPPTYTRNYIDVLYIFSILVFCFDSDSFETQGHFTDAVNQFVFHFFMEA